MTRSMLAMAGALLIAGCASTGGHVQRGINMYRAGAYQPAMQHWLSIQVMEQDFNPKGLCRYLAFRGLTHHRLGDAQGAKHFLTRAQPVCGADPRWLDPQAAAEVNEALGGAPAPGPGPATPTAPGATPTAPGGPEPTPQGPAPVEEPGT